MEQHRVERRVGGHRIGVAHALEQVLVARSHGRCLSRLGAVGRFLIPARGVRILLSNDDGIEAAGLAALERAASTLGQVYVVAPATEQSAKSHSFTMNEPLRVIEHGPRRWAVTGTPADAVYLAVHGLLPELPDLVLSGINRGSNLGTDVVYSGTVAAAREGAANDLPAVALSLHQPEGSTVQHWETAMHVAIRVARLVMARPLPVGHVLNVNVPNVPLAQLRGLRVAPLARRRYAPMVKVSLDPRGRKYYWIGGPHERFDGEPQADGPLCLQGFATLTPMSLDMTAHDALPAVSAWNLEDTCSTT
ncbi:MAG: 5'/3'-nucleotidase SurE [Myxococcales bacterium]|nr:5'/3'-nucleotidase SurE [Myxococcales bacterium]